MSFQFSYFCLDKGLIAAKLLFSICISILKTGPRVPIVTINKAVWAKTLLALFAEKVMIGDVLLAMKWVGKLGLLVSKIFEETISCVIGLFYTHFAHWA